MSPCLVAALSSLSMNGVTEGTWKISAVWEPRTASLTVEGLHREWELLLFSLVLLGGGEVALLLPRLCLWYQFSEITTETQLHEILTSPQPQHNCFQIFFSVFIHLQTHFIV